MKLIAGDAAGLAEELAKASSLASQSGLVHPHEVQVASQGVHTHFLETGKSSILLTHFYILHRFRMQFHKFSHIFAKTKLQSHTGSYASDDDGGLKFHTELTEEVPVESFKEWNRNLYFQEGKCSCAIL